MLANVQDLQTVHPPSILTLLSLRSILILSFYILLFFQVDTFQDSATEFFMHLSHSQASWSAHQNLLHFTTLQHLLIKSREWKVCHHWPTCFKFKRTCHLPVFWGEHLDNMAGSGTAESLLWSLPPCVFYWSWWVQGSWAGSLSCPPQCAGYWSGTCLREWCINRGWNYIKLYLLSWYMHTECASKLQWKN